MISIQVLAAFLLLLRIASDVYIYRVIRWQYPLIRLNGSPQLKRLRRVLLLISIFIFIGNVIPILIDALTMFYNPGRPSSLNIWSFVYALSNAGTAFLSAYLIHRLYELAGSEELPELSPHEPEVAEHLKD